MTTEQSFHCGYVAIVGRPNVGKSTLMNRAIGQKISITAPKPQTTRHQIIGIKTRPDAQILYVDTPGLHIANKKAFSRYLNRAAGSVIGEVDVVVFVVQALKWTEEDERVLERLQDVRGKVILAVNKVDLVTEKERLLPFLQEIGQRYPFSDVVPLSARKGTNLEALEDCIVGYLPESPPFYPEDQLTTRSERFLAAEIIREQLTRLLHQELPYALSVEIESFREEGGITHIDALVWVERDSQKAIIIGKQGQTLKEIGRRARLELNKALDRRVHLQVWVKVKEGWADDERALRSLGYSDEDH